MLNNDKKQEMLILLKTLVNIDSGSYDPQGVNELGSKLITLYENIGFKIEIFSHNQIEGIALGNHVCLSHIESKHPEILILAHLDTVFPKGEALKRPFTIFDKRAYGPGVIDMKASHVQIYYALKFLYDTKHPAYKNIQILLNSDEEIGSPSSQHLIRQKARGKKYALVMEPARPNGQIVSSRRGVGKYIIESFGLAAHAGISPKEGANAIVELSRHLPSIDKLNDHDNGISLNIGLIEGGKSVNTIADYAKAIIDLRVMTRYQAQSIDNQLKHIVSFPFDPKCNTTIKGGLNRPPMVKTESSTCLINIIKNEAEKLGISIEDITTGGGSDASFASDEGIATVDGLGPIGGRQHTSDEYLEIDSLIPRTNLLIKIIQSLCDNVDGT